MLKKLIASSLMFFAVASICAADFKNDKYYLWVLSSPETAGFTNKCFVVNSEEHPSASSFYNVIPKPRACETGDVARATGLKFSRENGRECVSTTKQDVVLSKKGFVNRVYKVNEPYRACFKPVGQTG